MHTQANTTPTPIRLPEDIMERLCRVKDALDTLALMRHDSARIIGFRLDQIGTIASYARADLDQAMDVLE